MIFGGIIPAPDFALLEQRGIKAIFTPRDYSLMDIMERIMDLVEDRQAAKR